MSSCSLPLPVINIAPWLPSSTPTDAEKQAVADALHAACRDFGFFYLNLTGFATEAEMDRLTDLGSKFFHLPQHCKDAIGLAHGDGARGYQRLKENVTMGKADTHEGLDFYRPVESPDKRKLLRGENQWPQEGEDEAESIRGFRETFEAWVEKMKVLGLIVMQA
jgi:isopenicillin N synthase-like dioxygenase